MTGIAKTLALVAAVLLVVSAGFAACVVQEAHREVELPRPTGGFGVGRTLYHWSEPARGSPGEIAAFVWYPASGQDGIAAPYLPVDWAEATGLMGANVRLQDWRAVRTHSRVDALAAQQVGGFPVVVLLPGYTAIPTDYTVLAEALASRGYVVVGVTPRCCARTAVDGAGRVTHPTRGLALSDADEAQVTALALQEVGEVRAVLGRLEGLNAERGGPLAGQLNLSRLAMVGHSLGGTASLLACAAEPRCRAVVDLDGQPAGLVVKQGVSRPVLILRREGRAPSWIHLLLTRQSRGERARVDAKERRDDAFVVAHAPAGRMVTLVGAGHGNFADVAVLSPTVGRAIGLLGPVDGRAGLKSAVDEVAGFLAQHL